jgi:hypothetical protein
MKRLVADDAEDSNDQSRMQRRRLLNVAVISAAAAGLQYAVTLAAVVANVGMLMEPEEAVSSALARPSQFAAHYGDLPDAAFRETFRVPRELFEYILQCLRPHLEYRYTSGVTFIAS